MLLTHERMERRKRVIFQEAGHNLGVEVGAIFGSILFTSGRAKSMFIGAKPKKQLIVDGWICKFK